MADEVLKNPYDFGQTSKQNVVDPRVVAEFHTNADTDTAKQALHHTLGSGNAQASPGQHNHDGTTSRLLMDGVTITGAKGGNVALANLLAALAQAMGFTDNTT